MGCYNTTVVNAPADKVWEALRNFHDMSWAQGVIEQLDVVGDVAANQIGAKRLLNGVFHETLLGINDVDRVIKYSITDGPGPLAKDGMLGYVGAVQVWPVTDADATFVEWTSSWESGSGEIPAFCNPIYQALLAALKKHFA